MKVTLALLCGLFIVAVVALPPWMQNAQADPASRAAFLLAEMTQQEKLDMVHGWNGPYAGVVPANNRLGIPMLTLEDGPQGVADGVKEVTAFPSALTITATWDPEQMYTYGVMMATEEAIKGTNVLLGPMINLARVPLGGRNFESMGEDPVLAGVMASSEIRGIQSQHVIVDNNQEFNRTGVSAGVDERTQYELYYPAFMETVRAGVGSIMCSYNRINDTWACENNVTLNQDLKGWMGFKGWVMSDWGATHSTSFAANSGLDQQMPDDSFFGQPLAQAITSGEVPQSRLDDMVTRILTAMFQVGLFDYPNQGNMDQNATSVEHNTVARELAEASTVLLQNKNKVLPLAIDKIKSIAVIGDNDTVVGDGSGHVIPSYVITPVDGIIARTRVRPANCQMEQNIDYYQEGSPGMPSKSPEDCCAECSAIDWCQYWTFAGTTCYLKQTNAGRVAHEGITSGNCGPWTGPQVQYAAADNVAYAQKIARESDVAIVVIATKSSEGIDRKDLSFDNGQDALVSAVASVNKNTIVVMRHPGAVLMPWKDEVSAIIAQFMPGQEAGNALASVLFGDTNPSGKLPLTFPNNMEETWLKTPLQYPGVDGESEYTEGLFMGYRWYDQHKIEPLFPFGFGLSYTTFDYSNLEINGDKVTMQLKNTGAMEGAEVVQMYVGFPSDTNEPPQLLKGFQKVNLLPGESAPLEFYLHKDTVSIWDIASHSFVVPGGVYKLYIGSSSRDIRLTGQFEL